MSTRQKRVEEAMLHALRELFLFEVHDPRITGTSITSVSMTPDLQLAHVNYVFGGPGNERDPVREALAAKGFLKVAPFLRHALAKKITLKYTPNLEFHYDEGLEKGLRVEQVLREIETEK